MSTAWIFVCRVRRARLRGTDVAPKDAVLRHSEGAHDLRLSAGALATELRGEHAKGLSIVFGMSKHRLDTAEVRPLLAFAHHADQLVDRGGAAGNHRQQCLPHGGTFFLNRLTVASRSDSSRGARGPAAGQGCVPLESLLREGRRCHFNFLPSGRKSPASIPCKPFPFKRMSPATLRLSQGRDPEVCTGSDRGTPELA